MAFPTTGLGYFTFLQVDSVHRHLGLIAKGRGDALPIFTEVIITLSFFEKEWLKNAIKSAFGVLMSKFKKN